MTTITVSRVFKVPKMLTRPPTSWTDIYGMRRAIKVLDLQAARLRAEGDNRTAHGLREVSKALKAAINKGSPVAECVTLGWANADLLGERSNPGRAKSSAADDSGRG